MRNYGLARRLFDGAAVALIAISVVACTAAASPSPHASAATSASPSEVPSTSGSLLAATPVPSLGPIQSLGPAPTGTWTSINWSELTGGNFPAVPDLAGAAGPNATLMGWSKGYVEFVWDPDLRSLVPWVSADGLAWRSGSKLDLRAWSRDFKDWDATEADFIDVAHDNCTLNLSGLQEGSATLLLSGYFQCGLANDYLTSGDAMWVSRDGFSWTPVSEKNPPARGAAAEVSGGSSGFITLGYAAGKPIDWLSSDGQTWAKGTLPAHVVEFCDPVSFAGGFVLPGVVAGKAREGWMPADCRPDPPGLGKYEGALWWSPDGRSWIRDSLDAAAGCGVGITVSRIDDHTLFADETSFGSDDRVTCEIQWLSRDGKSWTRLAGPTLDWAAILAGRDHGFVMGPLGFDSLVFSVRGDLSLAVVTQSGDRLSWGTVASGGQPCFGCVQMAIGPVGLLATADGERFWIGVPSTG